MPGISHIPENWPQANDVARKNQPQSLPKLGNYIATDRLGESLQASVFKGYHKHAPEQPLVIKLLKQLSSWDDQSRHYF